jgi:hypothetical protein
MIFLTKLHDGKIQFNKVSIIISDQALYAVKLGKINQELIHNIKHVTCS